MAGREDADASAYPSSERDQAHGWDHAWERGSEPGLIPDWDTAPGGPRALAQGCLCSVLANAAYRARADHQPCIDPRCPVHAHWPESMSSNP